MGMLLQLICLLIYPTEPCTLQIFSVEPRTTLAVILIFLGIHLGKAICNALSVPLKQLVMYTIPGHSEVGAREKLEEEYKNEGISDYFVAKLGQ